MGDEELLRRIAESKLTIYQPTDARPDLFVDSERLRRVLLDRLVGEVLDLPIRSRSKAAKQLVCKALRYEVPRSFKKTSPRFPGQNFDLYVQKANNLQIWNAEVTASRRYVILILDGKSVISGVQVVEGEALAEYDKTGKLTGKFQAVRREPNGGAVLGSIADTDAVSTRLARQESGSAGAAAFPVADLFDKLLPLVGTAVPYSGADQERKRAWGLHEAVCEALGMDHWSDSGQFPDVPEQLLEIKLQTSPTVDLGLVDPADEQPVGGHGEIRHCDVRYAVFYGSTHEDEVRLTGFDLLTGRDFFSTFRKMGGKVQNKKIQLRLPSEWFPEPE